MSLRGGEAAEAIQLADKRSLDCFADARNDVSIVLRIATMSPQLYLAYIAACIGLALTRAR